MQVQAGKQSLKTVVGKVVVWTTDAGAGIGVLQGQAGVNGEVKLSAGQQWQTGDRAKR